MFLYGVVALAFFALTLTAGYSIAVRFGGRLTWMETAVASPVIGIVVVTWTALIAYLISGNLDLAIGITALVTILIMLGLRPWKIRPGIDTKHIYALVLILASALVIMYCGMLTYYGGEYHIAFPLFGDTAFHTAIISSLSEGGNYPPQYPIMAGQPLRYTFLIDFYTALLDHAGLGLQWSVILPGIALMASLFSLLYFLGCRFTGRIAGGLITVAVVAFSGGLEFVKAFKDWTESGQTITTFLLNHNLNYTVDYTLKYVFTNFTDIIMAQRAALLGFGAGALIILITYILYVQRNQEENEELQTKVALVVMGILTGLLPLFHTYTYACIMISMTLMLLLYQEKRMLYFFVPALLLAAPQALYIAGQGTQSFIRLQVGWMAGDLINIPVFWIMNMGLELALLISGLYIAGLKKVRFYLPYLAIFVIANLIIFQTWDYDNHKFFSFWLMPSALFIATALLYIYDARTVGKPLFAAVFSMTILTGALVVFFIVAQPYVEFTEDEIYVADWVKENTPPDALFLTGDAPTQPVVALAGRLTYLGYYPWLYTHGLNTTDRQQVVESIYNAEDEDTMLRRIKEHNISYVVIGPHELNSEAYHVNQTLFEDMVPVFNWTSPKEDTYKIYCFI